MSASQNTASKNTTSKTAEIRPFRIAVPQADLDDLHDRLDRTRWTDAIDGADGEYGTSLSRVRRLAAAWRAFDWRAFEAKLNAYPQFLTEIDGQDIHFLHVAAVPEAKAARLAAEPDAAEALVLTHGWPGSLVEYLDVVAPLTEAGFDLVVPSIPGFGFAGPTKDRGWNVHRTARAWAELMARLGYRRYG